MKPAILAAALLCSAALACPAAAAIRLPNLFSDHAVLQRGKPIHVWGWATPGAALSVRFHGQTVAATADRLGDWNAWLAPEKGGGPYTLTVAGDAAEGRATVADVLVGDVWLASGQSNMEMPLSGFPPTAHVKNAAQEIAAATNPMVRLLKVERKSSDFPVDDIAGRWTDCTPETAAQFSAVGYFFARDVAAREHVPIGIIDSAWGGTPADSWVSTAAFGSNPALLPAFAARAEYAATVAQKDAMLAAEAREDAAAKAQGLPAPPHDWHPPEESWRPSALYNGMIAPLTGYALTGIIWYQGETNSGAGRAPYYEALFKGLITDWRHDFAQGQLPFLFAQISSFNSPKEEWGLVRDAQRRALDLAGTAMAVTTDIGDPDNVHPADKQTVGARLALAARATVYGEDVAYASPLFRQVSGVPGGLRVWFDHGEGLTTRGAPVVGFELAGADHRFAPADARIDGDTVVVTSAAVSDPRYVRYDWSGVVPGSLYNAAGLPASTFTSEERIASHVAYP